MGRDPTMFRMSRPAYTTDTSAEAHAAQLACIRRLAPAERLQKACRMSHEVRRLAIEAIRRRHPSFDDAAVWLAFIALAYGSDLAVAVGRWQEARRA